MSRFLWSKLLFILVISSQNAVGQIKPLSSRLNSAEQFAVSTGSCRSLANVFFSFAEKQSAMTTGSIKTITFQFKQDFRELCTDVALRLYRTFDGTCNHPKNWGASFTPVTRILPAAYQDSIGSPRALGDDGKPLPSPRTISKIVHPPIHNPQFHTVMVMQWGQWVDHDVTAFPVTTEANKTIKCCGPNGSRLTGVSNVNCFPIILPPDEVLFSGTCMEFVRSISATDKNGCQITPREQVNSLTSFLDASQVYGSTDAVAARLRDGNGIFLKTKNGNFLPEDPAGSCILRAGTSDYCFLAGDPRVTEHPGLGSLHTIWLRAHNLFAKSLRAVRPTDSDESIFQLTRKIIGALQQVITYNDWLPIILGNTVFNFRLYSKEGRTKKLFGVDPRILNEFSTAAMRFGHTMIPDVLYIGGRKVPFRQLFNRPDELLDQFDDVVAGLVGVGALGVNLAENVDRNIVEEVSDHLFEPISGPPGRGLDLISLNIQRGRDHGIPPYTAYRAVCGLRPLTGFQDTEALGPNAGQLGRVYKSVDDIDLFTGLIHEPPMQGSGGLVGPTLSCILGTQFFNLKFGDRFFFDTDESSIAFTDAQLNSLRNVTLAKIICATTNIKAIRLNVFNLPAKSNPLVPCRQLVAESLGFRLFASKPATR